MQGQQGQTWQKCSKHQVQKNKKSRLGVILTKPTAYLRVIAVNVFDKTSSPQ